jgi:hypothetical protein
MQAIPQPQQHKHIFFSGPKGIETKLKDIAMLKIKDEKFLFSKEKDDYIGQLILDQKRLREWILNHDPDEQKSLFKNIKRLRTDAIHYLINYGIANEDQIRVLNITEADLLFEQAFLVELVNYLIAQLNESRVFKIGCVWTAKGGHLIDYSKLNRISDDLDFYCRIEKDIAIPKLKKNAPREKYNMAGDVIEYGSLESAEGKRLKAMKSGNIDSPDETLTLHDCIDKIRELRNQYRIESYKTSAEKSIPMNLCYFLLYDPIPVINCRTKDEAFRYRISKLRKSNLLILLQLFRNIHNQTYKSEIEKAQKLIKSMSYKPKKDMPLTDKKELIKMGKVDGMSNPQISAQLNIPLRTVERYSKL